MIVVALSSGTSLDGIDVAVADLVLDCEDVLLDPRGHREVPYSEGLHRLLLDALPPSATTLEAVCRADTGIGREFATAAQDAVDELADGRADLVVSHGQTLYHWVDDGAVRGTLQLGQPAWVAEATGLPVVSDLRVADVAAGGQGAPLAGLLDTLLLGSRDTPGAALNLGGIANVTVVRPGADPVAFDTGPANALLDAAVRRLTGGREHVDVDGARAARGTVDGRLLDRLLAHPYYGLAPPKSTGKETFHAAHLEEALAGHGVPVAGEDLLATGIELTARTVADALRPHEVTEVLASGGGTRNPTLMARLAEHLRPARLGTTDELGLASAAKEAYLFALLGFLSWHGLPGTVPGCTGARHPTIAGRVTPGAAPLRLPEPATTRPARLRLGAPTSA